MAGEVTQGPATGLKILMQGKEVGSLIGKKGDNVKRCREESGARINISDGSCPERVVTVTGSLLQVQHAVAMICRKLEEDSLLAAGAHPALSPPPASQASTPVTIKLLVPGSQCGSLIGKGGAKIKELREATSASVQVASDMLPSSNERMVTLSGSAEAVISCISHICQIMTESPVKGTTFPYRPRPVPAQPQVLYATTTNAAIAPTYAIPVTALSGSAGHVVSEMPLTAVAMSTLSSPAPFMLPHPFLPGVRMMSVGSLNRANLTRGRRDGGYLTRQMSSPGGIACSAGAAEAVMQPAAATVQQLTIPNELIGCIIGRGGSKINEIRQLSGAKIKISNSEEGTSDRKITITGLPETIDMAAYMINSRLQAEV